MIIDHYEILRYNLGAETKFIIDFIYHKVNSLSWVIVIILHYLLLSIRVVQISPTFEFQRSRGLKLIE